MFFAPQRTITLWARGHHWLKTGGVFLSNKEYKRPDEKTLYRLLALNRGEIAGLILSLAWNMGLYREEMYQLKWDDISFEEGILTLPDRTVPIDEETAIHLQKRNEKRKEPSEYVLVSDRRQTHMQPQSCSRCARTELDKVGLSEITLMDLRHDFVIRQLEQHDWPYVARISGNAVATLYALYGQYMPKNPQNKPEGKKPSLDEGKLMEIIQSANTTPAGLTLWMCWKLELTATEVLQLTWDQIDMEKGTICLKDRSVSIDDKDLMIRLMQLKEEREGETDPHVVLRPNAKKPYQLDDMSRLVRTLLIRGGVEGMTLVDVTQFMQKESVSARAMNYVTSKGSVTRNEIMELLQITTSQTKTLLENLRDDGKLVKIGARYYPADKVVPPEEHYGVIRAHLETVGSTYRQEVAELLGIGKIQAATVLRNLVKEGKLDMEGYLYMLPGDEKK